MNEISLRDSYGLQRLRHGISPAVLGEIEWEIRDLRGHIVQRIRDPNIVKIPAKEILAHRLAYAYIWDPTAGSGIGAWVNSGIDLDEYAPKYFVFGASFDAHGNPLNTADSRYYTVDPVTNTAIPITLGVGAEYDGGLINAITIAEPTRPLKRVERIYWEPSYQPAGTPLLQADVRALNNVLVLETTLRKDEYNGFGLTVSDFFTLTEVALVGAKRLDAPLGACNCNPRDIFLTGAADGAALLVDTSGTATISIDSLETEVNLVSQGDQIKLVAAETTANANADLNQLNPYYLIVNKATGGRDITLDRVPVDIHNNPLTGKIGLLRDGFRIYSHRILKSPVKKSADFEIVCRWRLTMA